MCQDKINALLNDGLRHHRAGEIAAAAACYRDALQIDGAHPEALHLLGSACLQTGSPAEACRLFEQALAVDGGRGHTWNNLGLACLQAGRGAEAVNAYRQAARLQPAAPNAWLGLARSLHVLDAREEALAAVGHLLALQPGHLEGLALLATIHEAAGQWMAAAEAYRQLLPLTAETGKVRCNLGNALLAAGDFPGALAALEEAVQQAPEMFEAWHNLGRAAAAGGDRPRARTAFAQALGLAGRRETAEAWLQLETEGRDWPAALPLARRLAEADSRDGEAWSRLAGIELELGHGEVARQAAERAVAASPRLAAAWYNRGLARHRLDDFPGAAEDYAKALELDTGLAGASANRVRALTDAGCWEAALAALDAALAKGAWAAELPGNAVHLLLACCDWPGLAHLEAKFAERGEVLAEYLSPFTALAWSDDPALHQRLARAYGARLPSPGPALSPPPAPTSRERIRIGYLSADFHAHATAYLAADLFECHDRSRFAVFAYSTGRDDDSPMRRRLEAAFEHFRDLQGRSPDEVAAMIRQDRIDILVDLKGYTFRGLPQVLALRPAPIQVSYLGYPGTLGAAWADYIIADEVVIPSDMEPSYDERVIRLPHSYQPNDRQRPFGRAGSRADWGLPAEGMVYCCFNQNYKITETVFNIWLDILKSVSGSVLWLLDQNPVARRNLQARARAAGVEETRLVFAPPLPFAAHLGRLAHADLFLDTLPYNAHTTASDALWVGVPVLTVAGKGFPARVAASLLHAVGLPELVCADHDAYRRLAVRLAMEADALRALKEKLGEGDASHPLFDTPRYTLALEAAYEAMLPDGGKGQPR